MKFYINLGDDYSVKPVIRNNHVYEIVVYHKNKLLIRFRDSLKILPASLESLGRTLCPNIGCKKTFDHTNLELDSMKNEIVEYLTQDIRILAGVMRKAQEIFMSGYGLDVVDSMTIPSMALKIFRTKYYNDKQTPIHSLTLNEDNFIRTGYYGGKVDMYKPHGYNLFFYDVNSLYPSIMKSCYMPCGKPHWVRNLNTTDLDLLFGFVEAFVICPNNLDRPFLPYKKDDLLIFPKGKFIGVYFTEELKHAKSLGYHVFPIRGYIFEEKHIIFNSFVTDAYEARVKAKKEGNEPMSFIYKLIMNSLYGRFGISPDYTTTEVCSNSRYLELVDREESIIYCERLVNELMLVNSSDSNVWKPFRNAAVHISAAVTAYARIFMDRWVQREDCYYTDTDSVVLSSELPESEVGPDLGQMKLEYRVKRGIFLSAKSYMLDTEENGIIYKHKGAGKSYVDESWYEMQMNQAMMNVKKDITIENMFSINWKNLYISKKVTHLSLGTRHNIKRRNVYNEGVWTAISYFSF